MHSEMGKAGALADGRIALAKNNKRLALAGLGALRARVSELGFCNEELQDYVAKLFGGQELLLREALEALR